MVADLHAAARQQRAAAAAATAAGERGEGRAARGAVGEMTVVIRLTALGWNAGGRTGERGSIKAGAALTAHGSCRPAPQDSAAEPSTPNEPRVSRSLEHLLVHH